MAMLVIDSICQVSVRAPRRGLLAANKHFPFQERHIFKFFGSTLTPIYDGRIWVAEAANVANVDASPYSFALGN